MLLLKHPNRNKVLKTAEGYALGCFFVIMDDIYAQEFY